MTSSVIKLHGQPLGKRDFMDAITQEIIHLHDTGDIQRITTVIRGLDDVEGITGHAKARLLWASSQWWKQNRPNEIFSDHVEATTSLKKVTVDRYVLTWGYVEDLIIPKQVAERPMRDLVPIAKTVQWADVNNRSLTKSEWRKIELSTNDGELRDVLRAIKGKKPRKSASVIKLEQDGTLVLWKDNEKKFLGFLNIKDAETDDDIAKAITKIKLATGVIEE